MATPLRRIAFVALVGAAGVAAQFVRARNGYPAFGDLDPSGSFGDEALPRVDVVLLGDSTCTGAGLDDPADVWIRQLMPQLTTRHRIRVHSLAEGGAKVADVARTQLPAALANRWDVALVSVGANDSLWGLPMWLLQRRLAAIVDALLPVTGVVILAGHGDLGSPPRMLPPFNWVLSARSWQADRVHRRVAAGRARVMKVPMWADRFGWRRDDIWAADGFHPNAAGQALWAASIGPVLQAAIERAVADRNGGARE